MYASIPGYLESKQQKNYPQMLELAQKEMRVGYHLMITSKSLLAWAVFQQAKENKDQEKVTKVMTDLKEILEELRKDQEENPQDFLIEKRLAEV